MSLALRRSAINTFSLLSVLSAIVSSKSSSWMTCFLLRYFLTILVIRCCTTHATHMTMCMYTTHKLIGIHMMYMYSTCTKNTAFWVVIDGKLRCSCGWVTCTLSVIVVETCNQCAMAKYRYGEMYMYMYSTCIRSYCTCTRIYVHCTCTCTYSTCTLYLYNHTVYLLHVHVHVCIKSRHTCIDARGKFRAV